MKINKTPNISGYQKLMIDMRDKCFGDNNRAVAMCIKSKNMVESKLEDLRQQRDNLNELIGEYKAKADYARYLIIEVMRAGDLKEAGEDEYTVKRMKAGKPTIEMKTLDSVHELPHEFVNVVYSPNKIKLLDYIKENEYNIPDNLSHAVKLTWCDRLKFLGDKK